MVLRYINAVFDSIWQDGPILPHKFPLKIVKIAQSVLMDRCFKVYLEWFSFNSFIMAVGCPQVYCLPPILYNIFTADILLQSGWWLLFLLTAPQILVPALPR